MQPILGNEAALSFDVKSERIRTTTFETAIRLRRVFASLPITLVLGPENKLTETALGPCADRYGTADIQMFATLSTDECQLIFSSQACDLTRTTNPAVSQSVEIANQKRQVIIRTPPEWATTYNHWLPSLALVFGLALTTIATLVYRLRLIVMAKLSALSASLKLQDREHRTVFQTLSKCLPHQL